MTYEKYKGPYTYLVTKNVTGKRIETISWSGSFHGAKNWASQYKNKTGKPAFIFKMIGAIK